MAFKICPECAAKHGPRKKMCECGHYFVAGGKKPTSILPHPLYPEPGAGVLDDYHGLPKKDPPLPLPKSGLLATDTIKNEYVAYEGLGYCIYSYLPADRLFSLALRAKWKRARKAMQEVVEFLDSSKETRIMLERIELLRDAAQAALEELLARRGEARDVKVWLMRTIGLLRGALAHLGLESTQQVGIQAAKEACEELSVQALKAAENGDEDFSEFLYEQMNLLAKPVSLCLCVKDNHGEAA